MSGFPAGVNQPHQGPGVVEHDVNTMTECSQKSYYTIYKTN